MELIRKNQKQYKANLHSHSCLSDGKLTPEELVKAYKKRGYDILAITDHEYPCSHNELATDDFLLVTGYEAYIRPSANCKFDRFKPEIHLNLIAKDKDNTGIVAFDPFYCKYMPADKSIAAKHYGSIGPRKYSVSYIQKFIDIARKNGYLVSLNHPCWSMMSYEDVLSLRDFWSMEIFNTSSMIGSGYAENMPLYDAFLRDGVNMFCHGSDDNHNKKSLDDPMSDSFGAWTMILSDDLSYESVIESLEEGKFYASTGPVIKSLSIDENQIHIETTPASRIIMHMTPKYSKVSYDKDGGVISRTDFEIPKDAPYVYFSVIDKDGVHKAYTHAYILKKN